MNQSKPPDDLVERFAGAVLLPEAERLLEKEVLRTEAARKRVAPEVFVRASSSETLAVALRSGLFFPEVLDELFTRFAPRVHSWLLRWGAEYHLAFDLAQELLFHCLLKQRLETYDPKSGDLTGYLRAAARNCWLGECRRRTPTSVPLVVEKEAGGSSPEEEAEQAELRARVRKVLDQMSCDEQTLVTLVMDGATHEQTAETLGIEVSAVYGRLHRVRKKLAGLLGIALPATNKGRPRTVAVAPISEPRS